MRAENERKRVLSFRLSKVSPRRRSVLAGGKEGRPKRTHPVVLVDAMQLHDQRVVEPPHDSDLPADGRHRRRRRELALQNNLAREQLAAVPARRQPCRTKLAPAQHAPQSKIVRHDGQRKRFVRFFFVVENSQNQRCGRGRPGEGEGFF